MMWRVTYTAPTLAGLLYPVEVEAPDEMTAVMRAGMAREQKYGWFWKMFFQGQRWNYPKWERVSVEQLDD